MTDDAPDHYMIVALRKLNPEDDTYVNDPAPFIYPTNQDRNTDLLVPTATKIGLFTNTNQIRIQRLTIFSQDACPSLKILITPIGFADYVSHDLKWLWDHGIRSAQQGFIFAPMHDDTDNFYSIAFADYLGYTDGTTVSVKHAEVGDINIQWEGIYYRRGT